MAPTGLGPNRAQTSPHQPQRHGCMIQASAGCPVSGPGSLRGRGPPGAAGQAWSLALPCPDTEGVLGGTGPLALCPGALVCQGSVPRSF